MKIGNDSPARYLENVGIASIAAHADPLMARVQDGLRELGLNPMCRWRPENPTGIIAFRHPDCAAIHAALERDNIHVMHHAGRIRIAVHGYNTREDIDRLLRALAAALGRR